MCSNQEKNDHLRNSGYIFIKKVLILRKQLFYIYTIINIKNGDLCEGQTSS